MKPHHVVYACVLTVASGLAVASVPDLGLPPERDLLAQTVAFVTEPPAPRPEIHTVAAVDTAATSALARHF